MSVPSGNDPRQPWTTLGTRWIKRTPWRSFRVDRVRIHTGAEIEYSYLDVPPAVYVVPLLTDGRIALIHQYRYPIRGWVYEVPAGSPGDDTHEVAALRELNEEIGGTCASIERVGDFVSSSAHLTLRCNVYVATGVELGAAHLEETELLRVVPVATEEAFAWARDGRINDAQSALAVMMAEPAIRRASA
jgi:ADP-ribose pyrophosphatase